MNVEDLKRIISAMGTGRLGAFGEYVTRRTLEEKGHNVSGPHGNLKDFNVDSIRTDVKSHKRYMNLAEPPKLRIRNPVKDTDYVRLLFLSKDIAYYEENDKYKGRISYEIALQYWLKWPDDRKRGPFPEPSLGKDRDRVRTQFKGKLEEALGYPVYVLYRDLQPKSAGFSKGPDNLSLVNIKKGEKLMVYIQFKLRSTDFGRGIAFTVKDIQEHRFPMTYPVPGPGIQLNKEIVVTEEWIEGLDGRIGMWGEMDRYPEALFAKNVTLEQFLQKIIEKFRPKQSIST